MKTRMLLSIVATVIVIAATAPPAVSQGKTPNPTLTISSVAINYSSGTMTVTGTNLGQRPAVTFGTTVLNNPTANGNTLTVTVPQAILQSPGVYLLTIAR